MSSGVSQEHIDEMEGTYTWRCPVSVNALHDVSTLSQPFAIGGVNWRIQLMLKKLNFHQDGGCISLFLMCLQLEKQPRAIFKIELVNTDSTKTVCREAAHRFKNPQRDWGFTNFARRHQVYAQNSGFWGPAEQTTSITVTVRVEPPEDLQDSTMPDSLAAVHDAINSDSASPEKEIALPRQFICCISQAIMEDPVTAADGHTYERCNIEEWVAKCDARGRSRTSPMTREVLQHSMLYPNHAIRSLIQDWHQQHPEQ